MKQIKVKLSITMVWITRKKNKQTTRQTVACWDCLPPSSTPMLKWITASPSLPWGRWGVVYAAQPAFFFFKYPHHFPLGLYLPFYHTLTLVIRQQYTTLPSVYCHFHTHTLQYISNTAWLQPWPALISQPIFNSSGLWPCISVDEVATGLQAAGALKERKHRSK